MPTKLVIILFIKLGNDIISDSYGIMTCAYNARNMGQCVGQFYDGTIIAWLDFLKLIDDNSCRFAELTATVFVRKNYPVKLFNTFVPTPFVPYTVRKFNCLAGVMVTASHNPKEDNGYKVRSFHTHARTCEPSRSETGRVQRLLNC